MAMVRVIGDSTLHGRTYHLTNGHPTPVAVIGDVFENLIAARRSSEEHVPESELQGPWVRDFLEQMAVYRAYWRDDPIFARDNASIALPDLPAPRLTKQSLMRLGEWALVKGFCVPT
jgi:hypothetical protein